MIAPARALCFANQAVTNADSAREMPAIGVEDRFRDGRTSSSPGASSISY
jgi:hypothetical protein